MEVEEQQVKIPDGPNGFPTLSASQFRTYGAGGFRLEDQEDDKGCPSLYFAKYVAEERLPEQAKSYELRYGSMFHQMLYRMEEDGLTPDQALVECFDVTLPPEAMEEARRDLYAYIERGAAPHDRFGTLAVETDLFALLYVDPDFGPIYYRGVIDWIGVDTEDATTLHVVDYKTNRSPFSAGDIEGDVQMRGYHWLVAQNAESLVPAGRRPNIVTHLDAVKFRETQIRYTEQQIDDWHSWAVAVARTILRDDEHRPTLNTRCDSCPINSDCEAFQGMAATAQQIEAGKPGAGKSPEDLVRWRDEANRMRLILEKSVKAIDGQLADVADKEGGLVAGGYQWSREFSMQTVFDLQALHQILGPVFYSIVTTSKAAIGRVSESLDPTTLAKVNGTVSEVAVGTKIVKRKAGQ